MTKIFFISAFACLLNACTTFTAHYKLELTDVRPPAEVAAKEKPTETVSATDENVSVTLGPIQYRAMSVVIENKSQSPVSIVWDQSSLIDEYGVTQRIIHNGVKVTDKEKAMVPTIIPPGSKHIDGVVSGENVKWSGRNGWTVVKFFFGVPDNGKGKEGVLKVNQPVIGRKFKFFLTYTIDGKTVTRTYSLRVADVEVW